ncbi:hypothetical protein [Neisseria zalophi]|uniref:Uncharacterized protein n=1 Tax=Neisseria zalophi TaxID=640030 RepID=A0A5J6PYI9_9NEIS|nr:hypothetical protein [Neisseria zalophi]QEY25780.1 hypothetical protein D0T92_03985 [Neisseria zalophi]
MDHNDIRKGVLQAQVVDRNSGFLLFEIFVVPPTLAYFVATSKFVSEYVGQDSLVFIFTGFFLFFFFVYGVFFNTKFRRYIALFFSFLWVYSAWKFVGPDKPFSDYQITDYFIDVFFRSIPCVIIFLITLFLHWHDFIFLDDMQN